MPSKLSGIFTGKLDEDRQSELWPVAGPSGDLLPLGAPQKSEGQAAATHTMATWSFHSFGKEPWASCCPVHTIRPQNPPQVQLITLSVKNPGYK